MCRLRRQVYKEGRSYFCPREPAISVAAPQQRTPTRCAVCMSPVSAWLQEVMEVAEK